MAEDSRRRRVTFVLALAAVAVIAVAAGGIAAALARSGGSSAGSETGWMAASLRNRIGLTAVTERKAPGFALVDQRGRRVSLASLRGKAVVLDFMDPKCEDVCPIVSQEYLEAAKHLGARAGDVAFVAVNVNEFHRGVADVAAYSRAHRLGTLAGWHFLTGATPDLKRVWKSYGVYVEPNPDGDVVHSSIMYFVDPDGTMRYAATPPNDAGEVPIWGRGIAAVAEHMLG